MCKHILSPKLDGLYPQYLKPRGSRVQDYLRLHNEFKKRLDYVRAEVNNFTNQSMNEQWSGHIHTKIINKFALSNYSVTLSLSQYLNCYFDIIVVSSYFSLLHYLLKEDPISVNVSALVFLYLK